MTPFPLSKFEIIIGAAVKGRDKILPIYKIRTRDDGRFEIPSNLINSPKYMQGAGILNLEKLLP